MYYPEGIKARVSPVQWSKPYSILGIGESKLGTVEGELGTVEGELGSGEWPGHSASV